MKQPNLYAEGIKILSEYITFGEPRIKPEDIKTIGDIDTYRKQNAVDGQIKSRYSTMVKLYGVDNADRMMRELEVRSW